MKKQPPKLNSPTEEEYEECAQLAHELIEPAGMGKLQELLEREQDHSSACNIGVWYWSLGHKGMAIMAYEHSIKLKPEAPTYFNLAVCNDDLGNQDAAVKALREFYKLVSDPKEKQAAEEMLTKNNKTHLIKKAQQ